MTLFSENEKPTAPPGGPDAPPDAGGVLRPGAHRGPRAASARRRRTCGIPVTRAISAWGSGRTGITNIPHDYPGHWVEQQYMPDDRPGAHSYTPSDQGAEAKLKKRKE